MCSKQNFILNFVSNYTSCKKSCVELEEKIILDMMYHINVTVLSRERILSIYYAFVTKYYV